MDILSLIVIGTLLGGILIILKKGFNEVLNGLKSIDKRLKEIEDSKSKKS